MFFARAPLIGLLAVASLSFACKDEPSAPAVDGIVRQLTAEDVKNLGPEAAARPGDYVLDNGVVRFVVQSPESSSGWNLYGGSLADVGLTGAGSADYLEEIFVQCDLRGFSPREATIVSPGDATQPGVLRLVGEDAGIPFLDAILPRDPLEVTITVDLTLPQDGRTLTLDIAAKDERKRGRRDLACGLVVIPGDAHQIFVPDQGFIEDVSGRHDFLAAAPPADGVGYVLARKDGDPLEVLIPSLPFLPISPAPEPFLANATLRTGYTVTVGEGPGVAAALAARPEPAPGRAVQLTVQGLAGRSVEDATVLLESADAAEGRGAVTAGRVDGEGVARVSLPAGDYRAIVRARDRAAELGRFELEVPAGTDPIELTGSVDTLAQLTVRSVTLGLDGAEQGPTPARIRVIAGHGAAPGAGAVYETYAPAEHVVDLPEGDYTVVVSRGPEHELFVADVTLAASAAQTVQARLQQVVDRAGWITADLHVHGTRSTDSEIAKVDRVLGAAAEGLDVLVSSDHDAVTDYAPTVAALGLEAHLRTAPGTEMSPLYGHLNGYPLPASSPEDHWRPAWFEYGDDGRFVRSREPHEVVMALRAAGAQVVQLNHPRGSQHLFGYVGLDPETGQTDRPWPEADAIELLNGKRFDDYPDVIADVHGLLRAGRRTALTGTSDVHGAFGIGYARTYVRLPEGATASDVALDAVWTNLKAGRAVAASGPFVTLVARSGAASAEPGEILAGSGAVELDVRVQAPSWMRPERLRILQGATVVVDRPITAADADPGNPALRLQATFTATVTEDTYWISEVTGSGGAPWLREPLTVTNPVFADHDGNGWTRAGP